MLSYGSVQLLGVDGRSVTIKSALECGSSFPDILDPTHPARNEIDNISGGTSDVASDAVGDVVACERFTFLQVLLADDATVGIAPEVTMLDGRIIVIS